MAILKAAATANDTLDSTSDTLIDGLILTTPPAGDYLLWATVQIQAPASTTSGTFLRFNVFVGGVLVAHTERSYEQDGSLTDSAITYAIGAIVSPNGSQDVEIRHRVSTTATPFVAQNRELTLFPSLDAVPIEVSATGDATISSPTFAALMTATTPPAGTYLCTFGTSGQGPAASEVEFQVLVGGVLVPHSIRATESESSVADRDEMDGTLAVVVTPNGAEDVVVEWRRSSGAGTRTVHQRTLTLTPTDPVDVKEASSVSDDTTSSSADILVGGMTITDPGQDQYLALFTSYDFFGTIGTGDAEVTYSIREAGVRVTDSERRNDHEESIDSVNLNVQAGARVTVTTATSDLEMFWQNVAAGQPRTIHHRTFVAIRLRPFQRPDNLVRQAFGLPRPHPGAYLFRAAPVPPTPPPITFPGFLVTTGIERFPRTRAQAYITHAPPAGVFSVTPLPGVSTGFVGQKFLQ